MDLTFSFYIAATCAILITGISKSGFSGGVGVMSVPLMSLSVSPQFAAAVMMPILLAMDVLIVWHYRKTWDRRIVYGLLPAAFFGLGLGAVTFNHLDANIVRLLIGTLAMAFVLQFFFQQRRPTEGKATCSTALWGMGILSGFASFVAHAGGPPVKGYMLQQKLHKSWFVGTNSFLFFVLNFVKTIIYGVSGILSYDSLITSLKLSPLLFVGVFIGTLLHRIIDQALFVKVVYGFLCFAALKLLTDSLLGFL